MKTSADIILTDPEPTAMGSLTRRAKLLALTGSLVAVMMAGLDQTIVATAGPEIQRDLEIPPGMYAWITTAYLVASTVMLPIYGKLSDQFGRKPVLLFGVALFLFGSLLCGFAPTTASLIGARVVQGLGAASLFTTSLAVIADLFPPRDRGKYMGLIGMVMGISSVIGPLAGGVITDLLGWHWVFFVNLPVGIVAAWLIQAYMPDLGGGVQRVRIDYAGATLLVMAVVPLMLALSLGRTGPAADGFPWTSAPILVMVAVSATALLAFVQVERRAAEPILDFQVFRGNRTVTLSIAILFVLGGTFLFSVVFLPLFLVNVVGISATRAGLSLTPLTLAMVATSVLAGQMVSRFGRAREILLASLTLLLFAFLLMGWTLATDTSLAAITGMMVLIGLGTGPTLPLYTLLVQNASGPKEIGVVTSGSIFARAMGQVLGLTVLGTLFAASLTLSFDTRAEAELAGFPAEARAALVAAIPELGTSGETPLARFNADSVRAEIVIALTAPDGTIEPDQVSATVAAVDAIDAAYVSALTGAIRLLYQIATGLLLIALLLTAALPVQVGDPHPRTSHA